MPLPTWCDDAFCVALVFTMCIGFYMVIPIASYLKTSRVKSPDHTLGLPVRLHIRTRSTYGSFQIWKINCQALMLCFCLIELIGFQLKLMIGLWLALFSTLVGHIGHHTSWLLFRLFYLKQFAHWYFHSITTSWHCSGFKLAILELRLVLSFLIAGICSTELL